MTQTLMTDDEKKAAEKEILNMVVKQLKLDLKPILNKSNVNLQPDQSRSNYSHFFLSFSESKYKNDTFKNNSNSRKKKL